MQVLHAEEERFAETLEHGMKILDAALAEARAMGSTTLSGVTAFTLYDTYGFPLDLTADICRERGLGVDQAGFDAAMEQTARAGARRLDLQDGGGPRVRRRQDRSSTATTPSPRTRASSRCIATAAPWMRSSTGQAGVVVLDRTPFYAESGGQVGDRGELSKTGRMPDAVRRARHAEAPARTCSATTAK